MTKEQNSDPVMQELKAILGSEVACARWIKSVKGTVKSKSFSTLLRSTGSFEAAVAWLEKNHIESPTLDEQIARIHVGIPIPGTPGKFKRTTVSLDKALHNALSQKLGSAQAANAWLAEEAKKETDKATRGMGLSRALQAAAVTFVAAPRSDAS